MTTDQTHTDTPEPAEHVELAALADGTLSPRRQAELEARVAASPELAARLAEQRRAIEVIQAVAPDAPARLRHAVAAERRRAAPVARRRRLGFGAGLAVATAAVVLAVLFLLPAGVTGTTVIAEAAELQSLPPTAGPPIPLSRTLLDLEVEGVPFPRYRAKFGWATRGSRRTDEVHGHDAVTVFYAKGGRRIGYTILSGDAVDPPDDAARAVREGTLLRSFTDGGRTIVTWERGGRTCVMSGRGVPLATLYQLAGWHGKGTVPF